MNKNFLVFVVFEVMCQLIRILILPLVTFTEAPPITEVTHPATPLGAPLPSAPPITKVTPATPLGAALPFEA